MEIFKAKYVQKANGPAHRSRVLGRGNENRSVDLLDYPQEKVPIDALRRHGVHHALWAQEEGCPLPLTQEGCPQIYWRASSPLYRREAQPREARRPVTRQGQQNQGWPVAHCPAHTSHTALHTLPRVSLRSAACTVLSGLATSSPRMAMVCLSRQSRSACCGTWKEGAADRQGCSGF